ncbi:hypothetical protein [uncultured Shewanella sp.]|uniref:hypothetical protein n=1 Tax=uncultured Shewanella sp. TaxID=173975 RepID=UPI002638A6F0|nr:hypothetical protein [uncultured Shewanella sp.]
MTLTGHWLYRVVLNGCLMGVMGLLLQGCMILSRPIQAAAPSADPPPRYAVCDTWTQQWELHTQELGSLKACQYSNQLSGICMATFGLIVPLGSLIVSSSVYLVGNTLHWFEYQGRCGDGLVQKSLAFFNTDTDDNVKM